MARSTQNPHAYLSSTLWFPSSHMLGPCLTPCLVPACLFLTSFSKFDTLVLSSFCTWIHTPRLFTWPLCSNVVTLLKQRHFFKCLGKQTKKVNTEHMIIKPTIHFCKKKITGLYLIGSGHQNFPERIPIFLNASKLQGKLSIAMTDSKLFVFAWIL